MGAHRIKFISDEVMPEGHDFLLIQTPCGVVIGYRESAVTPETLEDSWAAYRAVEGRSLPRPPLRMVEVEDQIAS